MDSHAVLTAVTGGVAVVSAVSALLTRRRNSRATVTAMKVAELHELRVKRLEKLESDLLRLADEVQVRAVKTTSPKDRELVADLIEVASELDQQLTRQRSGAVDLETTRWDPRRSSSRHSADSSGIREEPRPPRYIEDRLIEGRVIRWEDEDYYLVKADQGVKKIPDPPRPAPIPPPPRPRPKVGDFPTFPGPIEATARPTEAERRSGE